MNTIVPANQDRFDPLTELFVIYSLPAVQKGIFGVNEQTELLREMRDLLLVIAEPALAKRDEKFRESLRGIVGKSKSRAKALFLMDGSRTQATIQRESGAHQAEVSRLVKGLREAGLINKNPDENPKLVIAIPSNFFDVD